MRWFLPGERFLQLLIWFFFKFSLKFYNEWMNEAVLIGIRSQVYTSRGLSLIGYSGHHKSSPMSIKIGKGSNFYKSLCYKISPDLFCAWHTLYTTPHTSLCSSPPKISDTMVEELFPSSSSSSSPSLLLPSPLLLPLVLLPLVQLMEGAIDEDEGGGGERETEEVISETTASSEWSLSKM